jgi:hypothetical protein
MTIILAKADSGIRFREFLTEYGAAFADGSRRNHKLARA